MLFGAAMGTLWLGVIPLVNGLVVQIFGLRFLSTLTGIAFLSHQAGSFLGAWGGGYLFDLMGSYDLAWKIGVLIGLVAGTAQLLMNDRPTERVAAMRSRGRLDFRSNGIITRVHTGCGRLQCRFLRGFGPRVHESTATTPVGRVWTPWT